MKTHFGANCDSNFGRYIFTCHSNLCLSKIINIDDIVINDNCFTYPLIFPEVNIKSPHAILLNCLEYALIYDNGFVAECKQATVYAVYVHRNAFYKLLTMNYHSWSHLLKITVGIYEFWNISIP